jgi:hypothetical protein
MPPVGRTEEGHVMELAVELALRVVVVVAILRAAEPALAAWRREVLRGRYWY